MPISNTPFVLTKYPVPSGYSSSSNPYSGLVYWEGKYVGSFRARDMKYSTTPEIYNSWTTISGSSPQGNTDSYLLVPDSDGNLWYSSIYTISYLKPDFTSTRFVYNPTTGHYPISGYINDKILVLGGYDFVDIINTSGPDHLQRIHFGYNYSSVFINQCCGDFNNNILTTGKGMTLIQKNKNDWEVAAKKTTVDSNQSQACVFDHISNKFITFYKSGGIVYGRKGTFAEYLQSFNNLDNLDYFETDLPNLPHRIGYRNGSFFVLSENATTVYYTEDFIDLQICKYEDGSTPTNMRWIADYLTRQSPYTFAFNEGGGEPTNLNIGNAEITHAEGNKNPHICNDVGTIQLTASNDGTSWNITYAWSGPTRVSFNDPTVKSPLVTATTPGDYEITCVLTDNLAGDSPVTATTTLTVEDCTTKIGNITITGPNSVCKGELVGDYSVSYDGDAIDVSYAWISSDAGAQFTDPDKASTKVTFSMAASHTVDCTITNLDQRG